MPINYVIFCHVNEYCIRSYLHSVDWRYEMDSQLFSLGSSFALSRSHFAFARKTRILLSAASGGLCSQVRLFREFPFPLSSIWYVLLAWPIGAFMHRELQRRSTSERC